MSETFPAAGAPVMPKNRVRQRENRKRKVEDSLKSKNEFGILDLTPKQAVEKIRRENA